jgi:hypothetical protein
MFFPESDHMKRRIQLGKPLDDNSMKEGRAIMRRIIDQWGRHSTVNKLRDRQLPKGMIKRKREGRLLWEKNVLRKSEG